MASRGDVDAGADATPICRCRVLYLGSAVPHVTKDGLQGIQGPLRELYPEQGALGARGIDSWLSVWSNGLLLENVDENHKKVTRFFPIDTLHYCAAVRYVLVPEKAPGGGASGTGSGGTGAAPASPRFLPLDSPFARSPNPSHPPLFAAILRRTMGIKVLECHSFICKREMAANALVRCCFHAYADSSYVRHIDGTASSVCGTMRSHNTNTIDRVQGWRHMSSNTNNGSTLTLNNGTVHSTTSNNNDDISIFNGDENHKIWAGNGGNSGITGDREEYYGVNTLRSARSGRPRQMVTPVQSPPPPPLPSAEESRTTKKGNKDRARRKKMMMMMGGSREELYPVINGSLVRGSHHTLHAPPSNNVRSSSSLSGTLLRNAQYYNNGTLLRPSTHHQVNGFHHHYHHHPLMVVQSPSSTLLPVHGKRMVSGTLTNRSPSSKGTVMVPVIPPPSGISKKSSKSHHYHHHHHPMGAEEPIYMPSTRPLSPIASYQPGNFPHEAYLMQHYATMEGKPKKKSKNQKKISPPAVANGNEEEEEDNPQQQQQQPPPAVVLEESPFNTGIYRKKGHLNERAFSYSIRQEHRSRSYGSLANLKFATPIPNGDHKEDAKKEREILQMMQDLDLSADDIERSEVPTAVIESRRAASARR